MSLYAGNANIPQTFNILSRKNILKADFDWMGVEKLNT